MKLRPKAEFLLYTTARGYHLPSPFAVYVKMRLRYQNEGRTYCRTYCCESVPIFPSPMAKLEKVMRIDGWFEIKTACKLDS